MVLPLITAGVTAAGALGSGFMGMQAANQAAGANQAINIYNLQAQQRESLLQRMMAERMLSMQQQGQRDALGNQTRFIEGLGFVTEATPETEALLRAERDEQLAQLTTDAQRARRGAEANEARRSQEGLQADALLRQMQVDRTPSRGALEALMLQQSQRGIADAFDETQSIANRQALRRGVQNPDQMAELARARADAQADAGVDARLQSIGLQRDLQSADQQQLGNLYNMFAARASGVPNAPVPQTGVGQGLTQQLGSVRGGMNNAQLAAVSAAGGNQGRLPNVRPNFGGAAAVGAGAAGVSELLRAFMQQQQQPAQERTLQGTGWY